MGLTYADVELINSNDRALVKRGIIDKDEVRSLHTTMLVDTGSYMLCINEAIQEQLDLPFVKKSNARLADESVAEYDVVGPLELRFKNRIFIGSAMVLPGTSEPLLGAIPMEEMDVLISPLRKELVVNPEHPDMAVLSLK